MDMCSLKEKYVTRKRPSKATTEPTSNKTIDLCIMNPRLMRRLVTLLADKVNLASEATNPWYHEMQQHNITVEDVKDAKDFVRFCLAEEEAQRRKYILAMTD